MVKKSNIILLIKNKYVPKNILVYFDKGWDTYFFPNLTNKGQSEKEIKKEIAERFWLPEDLVKLNFLSAKTEIKECAEHNNEVREYNYLIYEVTIGNFFLHIVPFFFQEGLQYYWKTIEDLRNKESCVKVNTLLIDTIEEILNNDK